MRILLIMPRFYDYYKKITDILEKNGHYVKYYSDEMPNSGIVRLMSKINKNHNQKIFDNYFDAILNDSRSVSYDKVIVIFAGRYFRREHISKLRNHFKNAEFIYYSWDSICNFPNIKDFYQEFDRIYSFDKTDCTEYGFKFLPLFYSEPYKNNNTIYDFVSIMTYGKEKADNYKMIMDALPDGLREFQYLVLKSRSSFLYNKFLFYKAYKGMNMSFFKYKPLNQKQTNEIFSKAKCVIDCPLKNQNGLTIRTFEVLNMRKKLITTNANIKEYDFYNENNIFVVDRFNNKISKSFFEKSFDESGILPDLYSLESFVSILLEDRNR